MKTYLTGQSITVSIPLVDGDGGSVVALAASYRVLNHEGSVVQSGEVTPWDAANTSATITVLASVNTLDGESGREIRIIELVLTTAEGTTLVPHDYMVERQDPLSVPLTSFQTYNEALAGAYDIPKMDAWATATRQARLAALIQARNNLTRLRYDFDNMDMDLSIDSIGHDAVVVLTEDNFQEFPEDFIAALKRAQLIEANSLMTSNTLSDMRNEGVLERTVGESSIKFAPPTVTASGLSGKPTKRPVCEDAYNEVRIYVDTTTLVARG